MMDYVDELTDDLGLIESNVPLSDVPTYNIIYTHPESLLSKQGTTLLRQVRRRVCALCIDEAHIVSEW